METATLHVKKLTSFNGVTKSAGGSHVDCRFTGDEWVNEDRARIFLSSK